MNKYFSAKNSENFFYYLKKLKRVAGFASPQKKNITLILGLTLFLTAVNAVEPLVMRFIIDGLGKEDVMKDLIYGILSLLFLSLFRETITAFNNWLTWKTRLNFHHGLLNVTVERIHKLPLDQHRKEGVGAIMTRLDKGIQGFIGAVSEISFNVLPALVYLVMAVIIMVQLDLRMTFVVLLFTPLPAMFAAYAAPTQKKREKDLIDSWSRIYSRFNEVLSGIVTVRSFAMEDYEKHRFLVDVQKANDKVVNGIRFDSRIGAMQSFSVNLARICALSYGGYLVAKGELSLGTLLAFLGYVGGLFGPVQGLTGIYKILQTASISLDHIFGILDTQDSLGDAPNAIEIKNIKGVIRFDKVNFSYTAGGKEILKNISLQVNSGETIAIVGPSGSGKSTMMALLQRFYDPLKGNIYLDGLNLKELKQQSIRSQIGVVLQDALLFNESIFDNIAYGRPSASVTEVENAAKAANAHEFIKKLEDGYNTKAGERGNRLSVGERQRIAIARALLKDPPILILDEATSALDTELEAKVQEALNRLIKNRTTFIIAHRLSTVVNADRIIVFKDGRILETGKHQELVIKNGYYASLVERQIKGLLLPENWMRLKSA
ncbi:ABC transporter ATP-binding protein [soil metagenome]